MADHERADHDVDAPAAERATDQPGSELMEAVALSRGLEVRRLAADIILCASAGRRVSFRGLAGGMIGAVARTLCRNHRALMSHLAAHDIPVADTAVAPPEQVIQLAVVGDRVVVAEPTNDRDSSQLHQTLDAIAIRAIAAIPGAGYGTVSLVVDAVAARGWVYQVDPMLRRWADDAHNGGVTVAKSVLDLELGTADSSQT